MRQVNSIAQCLRVCGLRMRSLVSAWHRGCGDCWSAAQPRREQRAANWCAAAGIHAAIFTHCGTGIVGGSERAAQARVQAMGAARGVRASLAHDEMAIVLRERTLLTKV